MRYKIVWKDKTLTEPYFIDGAKVSTDKLAGFVTFYKWDDKLIKDRPFKHVNRDTIQSLEEEW